MATGTATRNAIRPDHWANLPIHAGAVTRGLLPYITRAEPTWTIAKKVAIVASHDFTYPALENPAILTTTPVGWWRPPSTRGVSATSPPITLGTMSLPMPRETSAGPGAGEVASGCAVMCVPKSLGKTAADQNPLPVRPLIRLATRVIPSYWAVPVVRLSTGAGAVGATSEPGKYSTEPTWLPFGSTTQPALIGTPCTIAVASYRPGGLCPEDTLCTRGAEKVYLVPSATREPVAFPVR